MYNIEDIMDEYKKCKTSSDRAILSNKYKNFIREHTKGLVPSGFTTSERFKYLLGCSNDPSLLTRYFDNCKVCSIKFQKNRNNQVICSDCLYKDFHYCSVHNEVYNRHNCWQCEVDKSKNKYNESNVDEWVECHECGLRTPELQNHIIGNHNMTVDEYKEKYGTHIISKKKAELLLNNSKNREGKKYKK